MTCGAVCTTGAGDERTTGGVGAGRGAGAGFGAGRGAGAGLGAGSGVGAIVVVGGGTGTGVVVSCGVAATPPPLASAMPANTPNPSTAIAAVRTAPCALQTPRFTAPASQTRTQPSVARKS